MRRRTDGGAADDAGDFHGNGAPPLITSGPDTTASGTFFIADWTTDEPATSFLEWDTDTGVPYANNTSDPAHVIDHSLTALGLTPETLYYYRVCSTDPCGAGTTEREPRNSSKGAGSPPLPVTAVTTSTGTPDSSASFRRLR